MAASDRAKHEQVAQWTAVVSAVDAAQQAVLAQVGGSGLPAACFAVLQLLQAAPEERLPMTQIARSLSMTSGGFTKMADRMARDGLIDRRGASGDRRVTHAILTQRGRALARESARVYADAVNTLVLAAVAPEDLQVLARMAQQLNAALGSGEPENPFVLEERPAASAERRTDPADRAPSNVRRLYPAP